MSTSTSSTGSTRSTGSTSTFRTSGGITVTRTAEDVDPQTVDELVAAVRERRGGVLSSGMDYPGRYSRWHLGYVDPPIEIVARGRRVEARALNGRGRVLLPALADALTAVGEPLAKDPEHVEVYVALARTPFAEEERSRQPTVFTAIRRVLELFGHEHEPHLGLYGAFGYDLAFQFEPLRLRHDRTTDPARDLVLHLPDRLLVVDRKRETSVAYSYEFAVAGGSTAGRDRATPPTRPTRPEGGTRPVPPPSTPGGYAQVVRQAKEHFARGDLFEVVPGHQLHAPCADPAVFYQRLRRHNPAPYEFFLNLGEAEYLVGASPEMYVRVTRDDPGQPPRVETCPISGTIPRGRDAFEDAAQIRALLNSAKDESELTMCTDVDRNDKARVCIPGSVRVIGRRQLEMYSRLIHTADHVEGRLRPGYDALDAFLTHMWAVTVTGAPKRWAMQFIEDHEETPRRWYGGAIGQLGFDGSMNTGLTLRTAHIQDGVASVRVGATLLYDSDPDAEERETHLKAQALLDVLAEPEPTASGAGAADRATAADAEAARAGGPAGPGVGRHVLLVDHQDSFVHTLGDYLRQQGAEVTTLRYGFAESRLDELAPDLVVLSPGPGRPADFDCTGLLAAVERRGLPVFGVCLGLQAMVEHAGGRLSALPEPAHGKAGLVRVRGGELLAGLGAEFRAGRYHSLYAEPAAVRGFEVTAVTSDPGGITVAMAIEDPARRWYAVQFHPESILTLVGGAGHRLVANALALTARPPAPAPAPE